MVSSKMHQVCKGFNFDDPNFESGAYSSAQAYGQSKLAQIAFCNELRTRLDASLRGAVSIFAVHPGNVTTEVVRSLPLFVQRAYLAIMPLFLFTPDEGSRATLHAATASTAPQESRETLGYFDSNCAPCLSSRESRSGDQGRGIWAWLMKAIATRLPAEVKRLVDHTD